MPAQIRSAYPRFPDALTPRDLERHFTLSDMDRQLADAHARGGVQFLTFLVLLKGIQYLAYFPEVTTVPDRVVLHLRGQLVDRAASLPHRAAELGVSQATLYGYHQTIRQHLDIQAFRWEEVQPLLRGRLAQAAQTMNWVIDLINVAIEILIKERYELPAYSTLERLAATVRAEVHDTLFREIDEHLDDARALRAKLRELLAGVRGRGDRTSEWTRLKALPKRATLGNLRELEEHLAWLLSLGDEVEGVLVGLSAAKIKDLAAEARELAPTEMAAVPARKRQALALCLVHQARVEARDHLITMLIKRMRTIEDKAQAALDEARYQQRRTTERLVTVLREVLEQVETTDAKSLEERLQQVLAPHGGAGPLKKDCDTVLSLRDDNALPFMGRYFTGHRPVLYRLLRHLTLRSTSQDHAVAQAVAFIVAHEDDPGPLLPARLDLRWTSELWRREIVVHKDGQLWHRKTPLEMAVFSALVIELKTGDIAVEGSEQFADYRRQLLPWTACKPRLRDFCDVSGLPRTAHAFVGHLQRGLRERCRAAEELLGAAPLKVGPTGDPVLPKLPSFHASKSFRAFEAEIAQRMPERTLLEILWDVSHHTRFTRHFGPISGSDPHLKEANDMYVVTTFAYGVNLGPAQTAKHLRGLYPATKLAYVNRQHMSPRQIDAALTDIVNETARFPLIYLWGTGRSAIADGTHFETWADNLVGEMHIRYGAYGGIAYYYVSDTYQALLSRFITCGTYEAIYLLDLFLENESDFEVDTLHTDTHGQSAVVFGLAWLLGVNLQPRIRDWKEVLLFRSDDESYEHLDRLFGGTINWDLIETHWQDLMQVVLSVQAGTVLPSTLLRKLSSYSRKNKLYFAFRELGRVIRTEFLLGYLTQPHLRQRIGVNTNKIESFNAFLGWLFFGDRGVIGTNSADEQQKVTQHLTLIAAAVVLHNVIELTRIFRELAAEGMVIRRRDVEHLSPYLTRQIKRFGEYYLDVSRTPAPLDGLHDLPEDLFQPEPEDKDKAAMPASKVPKAGPNGP